MTLEPKTATVEQEEDPELRDMTRRFWVSAFIAATADLVDGASPSTILSTTCTRPARARSERAPRSAAAFIFFGVRWS